MSENHVLTFEEIENAIHRIITGISEKRPNDLYSLCLFSLSYLQHIKTDPFCILRSPEIKERILRCQEILKKCEATTRIAINVYNFHSVGPEVVLIFETGPTKQGKSK